MKLYQLSERRRYPREWMHLFHSTGISNIKSILKTGLDRGDIDRSYFGLSPKQAYGGAYDEHEKDRAYALVEVIVTKRHHEMSGHSARKIKAGTPLGDRIRHFEDNYDREELLYDPNLSKERRQYQAALSRYTRKYGMPKNALEADLPLPVTFSGNPRIVAIYLVSLPDNKIKRVIYGVRGASFKVGDKPK